ncbi:MAG: TolC family protein, partial [Sinobacteraceae bacterium]|nr:TolC family protein [Nevskiaceae bacterium]
MSPRTLTAFVFFAVLGGCSLAPKYQPPPAPQVSSYKEAGDWMPAVPADAQPRGFWWEAFSDPNLNELERQLAGSNPDLRAAVARFEEARGVAIQARSNLFPTVSGDASATRAKASANAPLSRAFGDDVTHPGNDFVTGLNLSWEIDLFGRVRNQAAAAGAQAQASAADLAAVQLALQAELASDYFSLRGDDATIQLLQDTIQVYDRAYELTRNRYQEGISAATDVDQADTLRQNARSQLAAVTLERAQLEHAIAVLLGKVPSAFSLEAGNLAG